MRYLVVLTVTEAKKFIAKTLVRKSDKFKRAFDQGRASVPDDALEKKPTRCRRSWSSSAGRGGACDATSRPVAG